MITITCPSCGSPKKCGQEEDGYDGILYWVCEECCTAYHRFPTDHDLRFLADRFVTNHNEIRNKVRNLSTT